MSDKKVKLLVIATAALLSISGVVLYFVFDKYGLNNHKTYNYINYNVNDYVEITPVVYDKYYDVYSNINVSKVTFKNINNELTSDFIVKQNEFIDYITSYYNQIRDYNYIPVSSVSSNIKTQINGAVLSVFYRLDFVLDENIFSDNLKCYVIALNIDLATNKVITKDELLSKYSYTKSYISDKLFNEDILITKNQVVVDKNTNISLTRSDIERKKELYVNRIIDEFNNIIEMYIEDYTLVLVYNSKELKSIFFDDQFDTNMKYRYLK